MRKVFLDDKRPAPEGYRLVTSAKHCKKVLREGRIAVLSLDYNLGRNQPKGDQVVKYMVEKKLYPKTIIIHSNSRYGRLKMYQLLIRNKPRHVPVHIRPLPTPRK